MQRHYTFWFELFLFLFLFIFSFQFIIQFMRDQASDSEEVVTPLMLDGTYLSRNFATLGPLPDSRRVLLSNGSSRPLPQNTIR